MSGHTAKLNAFPVFIRVAERTVVIVGDGEEALAKARLLGQSAATLRIVAAEPDRALADFARDAGIELRRKAYDERDLDGAVLAFAATGQESGDLRIVYDARAAGIPVNAVDRPQFCDFYTPALVNRAPVAVAIGTEGAGPVLAQMLRARIDRLLSPSFGRLAALAAAYRRAAEARLPKGRARRRFWQAFFEGETAHAVAAGDEAAARRTADALLSRPDEAPGRVSLVGAGCGAPDLLTLRAHRLLMEADVIVHDALVPQEILDMGRRDAIRIAAGKRKGCHSTSQEEINRLLVSLARQGRHVVRLKSGDPLVFGRAGEEMASLREAGIAHDIVPGITAALAAAADFGLPPTLRGVASSLVFTTGHDLRGSTLPDWARLAIGGATVAVYMGRSNAAGIASRLMQAGLATDTAVAVVENASRAERRLLHGTLADLPALEDRDDLTGPVITIIGDAVAGADFSRSTPLAACRRVTADAA